MNNGNYDNQEWGALTCKTPTFWPPKITKYVTEMRRCTGSNCGGRDFQMSKMSVGRQHKSNKLVYMCDGCLSMYKGAIEFEKVTPEVKE